MRPLDPIVIVVGEKEALAVSRPLAPPVSRWVSRSVGGAATVLLHLLISAPLVLGVAPHKSKLRTPDGPGSVAWASRGEQHESMILLDLSAMSPSSPDETKPDIQSEGITPDELTLELVSANPQPPPELKMDEAADAEVANEAAGDPAGNAAMFGRYMGHMAARIERAWMRPRTPINAGRFECRVRITQDRRGNVETIELQSCSEDEPWRKSLTSAILRASPLSAPPEPWLFTTVVTLNFSGEQYVANRTPDYEYEPVITRVAMAAAPMSLFKTEDETESRPSALDGNGEVDLTIVGSDVHWGKKTSVTSKK
jgi:hypothetical protein